MLNIHGQYRPKEDVDRLYGSQKTGRRGLMQLQGGYAVEITKLVK